jgi:hypothetical protein
MTHSPHTNAVHSIAAPSQPEGSRLVRNPARPVNSLLFAGWGPRIRL